jgi:release factor glutamine methyltransferase
MSPLPASLAETVASRLRAAGCVFAEEEARLLLESAPSPTALDEMVERRVSGEPLEQVLGWAEFCGLRVAVEPGVFVPRRRTGLLVREALALPRPTRSRVTVVDLCCGSGAVGAAVVAGLTSRFPGVSLHAADVDPAAVACARRNLPTGAQAHEGDLYAALPDSLHGQVDLLLANAPYVPTDDIALMPPEARDHEARVALDGGADGLDVQRRVIADAPRWLAPDGHLLVETSERQAARTADAFARHGLDPRVVHCDDTGGTVVVGSRTGRGDPRPV